MHPTGPCPEQDPPRDRHHQATLYASLELSRSAWLVTSLAPGGGKMSKHSVAAGDGAALLALLARLRGRVERSAGGPVGVVVVQEAGMDGFWVHRLLEAHGIESHVDRLSSRDAYSAACWRWSWGGSCSGHGPVGCIGSSLRCCRRSPHRTRRDGTAAP